MPTAARDNLDQLATAEVKRQLARMYTMVGRVEDAKRIWREQVRHRPDSFDAHLELGKLYARSGERRSALREYRALRRIISRDFPLGDSLRETHLDDSTRRCVSRSLKRRQEDAADRVAELRNLIAR